MKNEQRHLEKQVHLNRINPSSKSSIRSNLLQIFKKPSPEQTVGYSLPKIDRTFRQFFHPVTAEIKQLRETEMNETERRMFPCYDSAYHNLMWFEDISSAKRSISMKIVGLQRATHPDPAHSN